MSKKTAAAYIHALRKWRPEMEKLRAIVLDCGLEETFKWGSPCYMAEGANLVMLYPQKNFCTLAFMKGVLLKDEKKILVAPGEHSQSARRAHFTNVEDIAKLAPTLKKYIREAIAAERAGLQVAKHDLVLPAELQARLDRTPALKKAFAALTPGRRRGYAIFISQAKQSATRASRVEKCVPNILAGKGLNDRPT